MPLTRTLKYVLASVLFALSSAADAADLPAAIKAQLPENFNVFGFMHGDLNGDGRNDYLVALSRVQEYEVASRSGKVQARPLLIFTQEIDGSFRLAARNDHLIQAVKLDGSCFPFLDKEGFAIKNGYFTVQSISSCPDDKTDYITFRYEPESQQWRFHNRIIQVWKMHRSDDLQVPPTASMVQRLVSKAKPKAPIRFEDYKATF